MSDDAGINFAELLGLVMPEKERERRIEEMFAPMFIPWHLTEVGEGWIESNGIFRKPSTRYGLNTLWYSMSVDIAAGDLVFNSIPLFADDVLERKQPPPLPCESSSAAICAFRAWNVIDAGKICLLQSVTMDDAWPAGEPLTSFAPKERDTRGIHAFKNMGEAKQYNDGVYGTVALWGKVIEHERGYRAQFAYPQNIFVPQVLVEDAARVARALASTYGCEVRVV